MRNEEIVSLMEYFANSNMTANQEDVEVESIDYDGDVHCVTVPGSAFVVRSNDKISVTGNCHLSFMNYQIRELFDLSKGSADVQMIIDAIKEAVDQEIEYGHSTYGDWILGMSYESTDQYVKWLANQRCKLLGIGIIYPGYTTNPYAHLDARKRENFFEKSAVTEYSNAAAVEGWDDF